MSRKRISAAAVALLAGVMAAGALRGSDDPKGDPQQPLAGKVVVVLLRGQGKPGHMEIPGIFLKQPEVKKLGDHSFLTGERVRFGLVEHPLPKRVWLSLQEVQSIDEYDSIEALQKAYPSLTLK